MMGSLPRWPVACAEGCMRLLQINTTLTKLDLNSNAVDYDGTKALASALAENTSLTAFSLRLGPAASSMHRRCALAGSFSIRQAMQS